MADVYPPPGDNGIAFCVSDPDWFKQLRGVVSGDDLTVTLKIKVKKSTSDKAPKPMTEPMSMDAGGEGPKPGKKGKEQKEWSITGTISEMTVGKAAPDDEEAETSPDDEGAEGEPAKKPGY